MGQTEADERRKIEGFFCLIVFFFFLGGGLSERFCERLRVCVSFFVFITCSLSERLVRDLVGFFSRLEGKSM